MSNHNAASGSKIKRYLAYAALFAVLLVAMTVLMLYFGGRFSATVPDRGSAADFVTVHFIDVDQGDCALIVAPSGETVLIDAGPGYSERSLIGYLEGIGVKKIDYAVFTHPHEDHIGGGDAILREFDVKNILMTPVPVNTPAFDGLMYAIENSSATLNIPIPGTSFQVGALSFTVLAPLSDSYESTNDYSIVLRMDYGDTAFLFTGDAEMVSESEMLTQHDVALLDCDVLKIGHHGSFTSTSPQFFSAVSPQIAVISCGKENDYGHPHRQVRQLLTEAQTATYRTDQSGTILIISDGTTLSVAD